MSFWPLSDETFRSPPRYLTDQEILGRIQKWIQEDKAGFLSKAINNIDMPLVEIINAITHYQYISGGTYELSPPMEKGLRVSLIRRFFSDDLEFINIAKNHIEVRHFYDLVQRIIYPANGYGQLGRQERRPLPGPEDPLQAGRASAVAERSEVSPRPGISPRTAS